ncbi:MAG: flagellar hook-basal body protein [Bacillota bacterium]|nr:flagellar hook-basal body protein [Bacillota bacterium]
MIKGLYTAAAGMMVQMGRQDVIANNIANVNTGGFKKDVAIVQAFPAMLISRMENNDQQHAGQINKDSPVPLGSLSTGACIANITTDYAVGSTKVTDRKTDLAIGNPNGFFVVQTPEGDRFTRNGSFVISADGFLVNQQDYPVLDDLDQMIPVDGEFAIDRQGMITMNGETQGRIKIVQFEDPQALQKEEDLYNNLDQVADPLEDPGILQGYQELSNVNAVKEMVQLINTVRAYETCQKVVQAEDESLDIAINQVGAVV